MSKRFEPWGEEVAADRQEEVDRIRRHVEISLNALIDRQQCQLAEYLNRQVDGQTVAGLDGLIKPRPNSTWTNSTTASRRAGANWNWNGTRAISDITHLGRAWVLPHPSEPARNSPRWSATTRSSGSPSTWPVGTRRPAAGWSKASSPRTGLRPDLAARPHPEDSKTFIEVRFIEVKGRAGVGVVALSENEYRTAERLKGDYWLYAVFNCGGTPELHTVQNPFRLGWQPVMAVEHYRVAADEIVRHEQ